MHRTGQKYLSGHSVKFVKMAVVKIGSMSLFAVEDTEILRQKLWLRVRAKHTRHNLHEGPSAGY